MGTDKEPLVLVDERNMGGARYNLGVLSAVFSPDNRWLATAFREKQRILTDFTVATCSGRYDCDRSQSCWRNLRPEEAACYELSDLLD